MKKTVFSILAFLMVLVLNAQSVPATTPVVNSVIYKPQSSAPSNPSTGQKYLHTNGTYYRWNGTAWVVDVVGGTNDASELTTGLLPDGRVQQSNVTQHQGALSISESQISDLSHTVDTKLTNSEVEAAYNAQVPVVTQGIAETGTSTDVYRWTPEMINFAIQGLAPPQSLSNVLGEGNDAGGNTITGLSAPVDSSDVARKYEIDAIDVDMAGITHVADFTMSDSDVGEVHNIVTNDSIVVHYPPDLTNFGFTTFDVDGTGFVAVVLDSLTTTNGNWKSQSGSGEGLSVRNFSATKAHVRFTSQALAYTPIVPSSNLYTGLNAAGPSDTNATTGTSSSDGEVTWSVLSSNADDGTYHLRAEKTGGTDNDISEGQIELTGITNGQAVHVSIRIDESSTVGTNWSFLLEGTEGWAVEQSQSISGTGYNTWVLSATATMDAPSLTVRTTSSGDVGDLVDVDTIIVTLQP